MDELLNLMQLVEAEHAGLYGHCELVSCSDGHGELVFVTHDDVRWVRATWLTHDRAGDAIKAYLHQLTNENAV